jgi:hypothetical protein
MRKYLLIPALLAASLSLSCAGPKSETPAPGADGAPEYNQVATIQDIMNTMVDPAADYIWESVGTEVSAAGVVEKAPRNPEEWKLERQNGMILVEAANLLMMPGRKVASSGAKSENPGIELEPHEIEALIAKDRPKFIQLAKDFQKAAIEQLKAIENKDVPGMMQTGGEIEPACEACHKVYWYPNDPFYKDQKLSEPAPEKK